MFLPTNPNISVSSRLIMLDFSLNYSLIFLFIYIPSNFFFNWMPVIMNFSCWLLAMFVLL